MCIPNCYWEDCCFPWEVQRRKSASPRRKDISLCCRSTMVTAILPAMTYRRFAPMRNPPSPRNINGSSHAQAPSISSELTITPARFRSRTPSAHGPRSLTTSEPSVSQLAGIVGMLTGFGALVALLFFLQLPTRFQDHGISSSQAVADSFYVVGNVALAVAVGCFFGLRGLSGEEDKGWRQLLNRTQNVKPTEEGFLRDTPPPLPSYPRLFAASITLGIRDMNIGLGYVGGFVARASSVGISLFIPLFVNAYFIKSGRCPANPGNSPKSPSEIKENCTRAYIVASIISGVSQLVALICAPIFGYLSSVYQMYNLPLSLASVAGIAGYAIFGNIKNPDPQAEDGSYGVFFIAALLGISQIGAIVCSLGLLARGIEAEDDSTLFHSDSNGNSSTGRDGHLDGSTSEGAETSRLLPSEHSLPSHLRDITGGASRSALKGSIAGVYSLVGGAGILLLTKVGGLMFDKVDPGSPFFLMAGFNAVLFAVTLGCDVWTSLKNKHEESLGRHEDMDGDLRATR